MGVPIIFRQVLLLACCWLFFSSHLAAADEDKGIRFVVKPKLCVLSAEEEECHDTLEILWQAHALKSVCLFQNNKTLPLRCWEDEMKGKHAVEINTGEDIEFQLREIKDASLVIAQSFEVIHDKQEFRRKRRNPWSFF